MMVVVLVLLSVCHRKNKIDIVSLAKARRRREGYFSKFSMTHVILKRNFSLKVLDMNMHSSVVTNVLFTYILDIKYLNIGYFKIIFSL